MPSPQFPNSVHDFRVLLFEIDAVRVRRLSFKNRWMCSCLLSTGNVCVVCMVIKAGTCPLEIFTRVKIELIYRHKHNSIHITEKVLQTTTGNME